MVQSLAVLPFANLSGDSGQEFFADGMTEELITKLAQVSALRVISRTSVMQYKGARKPLSKIGLELGVKMIVEGSVQRAGGDVRITAKLIDARTEQNLWADSFQRSLSNVFALQSDIARAIVERVRVEVTPAERMRIAASRPVNPAAHEAYLRGLNEYNKFTTAGFLKSLDYYQQALGIDPTYARASAGLANLYCAGSTMLWAPREAMPRARVAARAALEIDSTLAEARGALGYVTAFYDWNWRNAEADLLQALELSPGSAGAHQNYGYYLLVNGRFREAEERFRMAHELDPLNNYIALQTIYPLNEGRRYDETIKAAGQLLRRLGDHSGIYQIMGQALLKKGRFDEAIETLERARGLDDNPITTAWLAHAYGVAGNKGKATGLLNELQQRSNNEYVGAYDMAVVYAGLGDRDRAFMWLERGLQDRSEGMVYLKIDPGMDILRSDARFGRLLQRLGFSK